MALHLRVIESHEELHASAAEWSRLLQGAGGTVFLTPQWITSWFAALEGAATPAVLVAEDDTGRWRGVLPMARTRVAWAGSQLGVTDFAGAQVTTSDHLGILAAPADFDDVWACVRPWIDAETRSAHVLRFSGMDDGPTAARVRTLGQQSGWAARGPMREVAPFLTLPRTYEDFESGLSVRRRQRLRRDGRRLQQLGHPIRLCVNDAVRPIEEVIDDMARLHTALWRSRGRAGTLGQVAMHRFVQGFSLEAHRQGWLRLHQLYIGDRMAAAILVLHWGTTASYYQSGWDVAFGQLRVAELVLLHSIRCAIEERMQVYDLLRGDEQYKERFSATAAPQVSFEFAARPLGRIYLLAVSARVRLARLVRSLAQAFSARSP
jgi:CelD/BcsL family acetyltransferase involved in cellulose biosynthesis